MTYVLGFNDNEMNGQGGGLQMELPLSGRSLGGSLKIVPMSQVHGSDVILQLRNVCPKYVYDIRAWQDFNVPGLNRKKFFSVIGEVNCKYISKPLDWSSVPRDGSMTFVPNEIQKTVRDILLSEKSALIMVDGISHGEYVEGVLESFSR